MLLKWVWLLIINIKILLKEILLVYICSRKCWQNVKNKLKTNPLDLKFILTDCLIILVCNFWLKTFKLDETKQITVLQFVKHNKTQISNVSLKYTLNKIDNSYANKQLWQQNTLWVLCLGLLMESLWKHFLVNTKAHGHQHQLYLTVSLKVS